MSDTVLYKKVTGFILGFLGDVFGWLFWGAFVTFLVYVFIYYPLTDDSKNDCRKSVYDVEVNRLSSKIRKLEFGRDELEKYGYVGYRGLAELDEIAKIEIDIKSFKSKIGVLEFNKDDVEIDKLERMIAVSEINKEFLLNKSFYNRLWGQYSLNLPREVDTQSIRQAKVDDIIKRMNLDIEDIKMQIENLDLPKDECVL